jgi:hypothetical protein
MIVRWLDGLEERQRSNIWWFYVGIVREPEYAMWRDLCVCVCVCVCERNKLLLHEPVRQLFVHPVALKEGGKRWIFIIFVYASVLTANKLSLLDRNDGNLLRNMIRTDSTEM